MLGSMGWRRISTSAILYSRKTKYPTTLNLCLPPYSDSPVPFTFNSLGEIKEFLQPNQFLVDPTVRRPITSRQVDLIDFDKVYDLVGGGFTYRHKGLSRDQFDKVFEQKAALALKEILMKEDPGIVELPRVIKDKDGKDVSEWEAIFESSDGCIIFLEAKFRMFWQHVFKQSERMSRSLRALGKQSRAKLFLAGYFWHDDEDCISFTRQLGYGIIQPNGKGLTVEVMAVEKEL